MTQLDLIPTTIEILGKPISVKCPENEIKALQESAQYLEKKINTVRQQSKTLNIERAIMAAALNIAYQFLALERKNEKQTQSLNQKLMTIESTLETALAQQAQLELTSAD